jgi:hypothetical protein
MPRRHSRINSMEYADAGQRPAASTEGSADCLTLASSGVFPEPMPDPSDGSRPALFRLLVRTT